MLTSSIESVADYLERPLYSISGGELSTEVTQLEKRLDVIFALTKRWDAVCLLDEADVLLCKRNSAEMDRNAIVAGTHTSGAWLGPLQVTRSKLTCDDNSVSQED